MTPKQALFVNDYVTHRNASRAARVAGYGSARSTGSRLLKDPQVRAEIERRTQEHLATEGVNKQWVVDAIVREIQQAQLAGNKSTTVLRGLELLAKHLGMFVERTEVSFEATMLETLAQRMIEGQNRVLEAKEEQKFLPEPEVQ